MNTKRGTSARRDTQGGKRICALGVEHSAVGDRIDALVSKQLGVLPDIEHTALTALELVRDVMDEGQVIARIQSEHLMAGVEQSANQRRSDDTLTTGDQNPAHDRRPAFA
jgi:hypothetical protein